MNAPTTAREALILEALGEAAHLIQQVESLVPALEQSHQSIADARSSLAHELRLFEHKLHALTQKAKADTVQHIVMRTEQVARRSIDEQGKAMADAARVAFGAELGTARVQLQSGVELLLQRLPSRWERCLTHAAVAAGVATLTWTLTAWARAC